MLQLAPAFSAVGGCARGYAAQRPRPASLRAPPSRTVCCASSSSGSDALAHEAFAAVKGARSARATRPLENIYLATAGPGRYRALSARRATRPCAPEARAADGADAHRSAPPPAYKERQTACLATLSLRAAKARRRATRQADAAAKAEDEYRRTALAAELEEEEMTRNWAQRAAMCAAADALEQRQDAERLAEAAREAEALLQRMLQDL